MSLSMRRTTAAGALILSVGLATSVPASASPAPAPAPAAPATAPGAAQLGAGWLGRQFTGKDIVTGGAPDASSTVQAVLAFAASGVGGTKAHAAMGWLKKNFGSYVTIAGTDQPGSLAYVILAAQALGIDPTTFGGKKPANNLIDRLEATQRTTATDAGLFGSEDPTFDGAFRQGLSLMALTNQGIPNSNAVVQAGVTWLKNQQCSDGGWESYRSDVTTACAAPDPSTFTGPDTNSTSVAVEGLVAAGATFPVDPLPFFEAAQDPDGGFGFIGISSPSTTQPSDPDSTGEVIQALVALHQLANAAFTKDLDPGTATPVTALATFQLGCAAASADRGASMFPGDPGPNLVATVQAVPGAAQVAFPLKDVTLKASLPKMKCPAH